MRSVIFFGVGSPYGLDLEVSCRRLGWDILAYIVNYPGPVYVSDESRLIDVENLPEELLRQPVIVPLITPGHRKSVCAQLDELGIQNRPALIDPTAVVADNAEIGTGVTINAAASVGAFAKLGYFSAINRSATLGHHSILEAYVSLGPGVVIAGSVHIDAGVFVGAGAVVLPEISIGRNTVVGAGAVVTKDVPDHCIVVGNPARIVSRGIQGYGKVGV